MENDPISRILKALVDDYSLGLFLFWRRYASQLDLEAWKRRVVKRKLKSADVSPETQKTLLSYFCALSNFYGAVPVSKAYEIILRQNPGLASEEKFRAFTDVIRHTRPPYAFVTQTASASPSGDVFDLLLADVYWLMPTEAYTTPAERLGALIEAQGNLPYFELPKDRLLEYMLPFQFDMPPVPVADTYAEALEDTAGISEMEAGIVLMFAAFALCRRTLRDQFSAVQEVMDFIAKLGGEFHYGDDAFEAAQQTLIFGNDLRRPILRGYRSSELEELFEEHPEYLPDDAEPGKQTIVAVDSSYSFPVASDFQESRPKPSSQRAPRAAKGKPNKKKKKRRK